MGQSIPPSGTAKLCKVIRPERVAEVTSPDYRLYVHVNVGMVNTAFFASNRGDHVRPDDPRLENQICGSIIRSVGKIREPLRGRQCYETGFM